MTQLRPPAVIVRYFDRHVDAIIVQEFPRRRMNGTRGWVTTTYRKRASVSWARKLARAGVTLAEIIRGGTA